MKVLAVINSILPSIAEHLSFEKNPYGGWIVSFVDGLRRHGDIELTVAFPVSAIESVITGSLDGFVYYGFPKAKSDTLSYSSAIEKYLESIIDDVKPDLIHVFGTEYPHSLAIVNASEGKGLLGRTLIGIQGLVSVYAKHYMSGVPMSVLMKRDYNMFVRRGIFEIQALDKAVHVTGRTDWDLACTSQLSQKARYHFCNESLRDAFYSNSWKLGSCDRFSIFMSQASYPIKGLQYMLEAMPEIIRRFPEAHLYIAGHDLISSVSFKSRLKIGSYENYIRKQISKNGLLHHITFTGALDEQTMCERYLKSHVFVSASTIENSPNSVGEAMILGVPTITSDVGGVKSMMTHEVDGLIYQHDAPYMLAHYICKIFGDDNLACTYSENARARASITHDRAENLETMISIYREICDDTDFLL